MVCQPTGAIHQQQKAKMMSNKLRPLEAKKALDLIQSGLLSKKLGTLLAEDQLYGTSLREVVATKSALDFYKAVLDLPEKEQAVVQFFLDKHEKERGKVPFNDNKPSTAEEKE